MVPAISVRPATVSSTTLLSSPSMSRPRMWACERCADTRHLELVSLGELVDGLDAHLGPQSLP